MKSRYAKNKNLLPIILVSGLGFSMIFILFMVNSGTPLPKTSDISFNTQSKIQLQDVVSGDGVFITTQPGEINKFIVELDNQNKDPDLANKQSFGIGIFVQLKDSNGKIVPQKSNLLPIDLQSLVGLDGNLYDFAKIQFDIYGLVLKDTNIQATVDYELVSNNNVFLTGKAFGTGMTKDGQLNLFFEQGKKVGEVLELDFEKNEVPIVYNDSFFRNTLEVRITKVEAVVGNNFDTKQYKWSGSFPVYVLKFDSDKKTNTVRDYRGIAIQSLPNDVGIQVCGYDNGRLFPGQDFGRFAPSITVKKNNVIVLTSVEPSWGYSDADFNSSKCSSPVSGLERNTDYVFVMHDGSTYNIRTSDDPFLYYAKCIFKESGTYQNPKTLFPCTSNFGWSG